MQEKSPHWQKIKEVFAEEYKEFYNYLRTLRDDSCNGIMKLLINSPDKIATFEGWPEAYQAGTFHAFLCMDIWTLTEGTAIQSQTSDRLMQMVNIWFEELRQAHNQNKY